MDSTAASSPDTGSSLIVEPVVLIVDDDPSVLEAISTLLTPRLEPLFRVETASSAEEGLELLEQSRTTRQLALAAVISDEKMPGRTGVELLIELRRRPEHVGGGRIIITGYAGLESAKRAINEAEVEKYLPKPWQEEELLSTVGDLLVRFERARGWDACEVVTIEEFESVRDEVYALRRERILFEEMRLDDVEVDEMDLKHADDETCRFAIVRRWAPDGREAQAFLRFSEDAGAVIEEWTALPTRDHPKVLSFVVDAIRAHGAGVEPRWRTEGLPLPAPWKQHDVLRVKWANEQRLCSCHQAGCVGLDYTDESRSYHCPLDRLEGRSPSGFPSPAAGR